MWLHLRWTVIVAAAACAIAQAQTTIYVNGTCGDDTWTGLESACAAPDGPKRTIRAAIDVASSGDAVVLAEGVYTGSGNRDLDFGGRAITVRAAGNDPERFVLDLEASGRAFVFTSGETGEAVVRGLTIRNGAADMGGAVFMVNSGPTLIDCVFQNNVVPQYGGAIYMEGGSPTVQGCTFVENAANGVASDSAGGAIASRGSTLALLGSTFVRNAVEGVTALGGGVWITEGVVTIENCTFNENRAISDRWNGGIIASGGALSAKNVDLTVRGAEFSRNSVETQFAVGHGGAVDLIEGNVMMTGCVFVANLAYLGGGGAIVSRSGDPVLVNCLFVLNYVKDYLGGASDGGAIYVARGAPIIRNCTFDANFVDDGGAGDAMFNDGGFPVVSNSVFYAMIWQNSEPIYDRGGGVTSASYSNIENGWSGIGNIDVAPKYVRPAHPGPDGWWGTPDDDPGDHRLLGVSPCIDAGDNTSVPAGTLTDLIGHSRFVDSPWTPNTGIPGGAGGSRIVDMGACEYQALCYADCDQSTGVGVLDIFDFLCFQNSFVFGEPYACECETSTGPLVCDVFDFLCFQSAFTAGCP